MTTDYDRLLAACAAHPNEDTPRLMLADALDESGTDPARAELIRLQTQTPTPGDYLPECDSPVCDGQLVVCKQCRDIKDAVKHRKRREPELIAANEARWRKGPVCPECDGCGVEYAEYSGHYERVGRCSRCFGPGDLGGLAAVRNDYHDPGRWRCPVRFDRGFITRVEVSTLGELMSGESPSPWLRAVLTATPERELIREVVPLDMEPWESGDNLWNWSGADLPYAVMCLALGPHPTRDAAVTALGRAVVTRACRHLTAGL